MPDPITIEFEAALAELDRIVEALEHGGPDLSAALAGYGRGVALLGHCQGILDHAERAVALLTGVDDSGAPITAPFDATATGATAPTVVVEAVPVAVEVAPTVAPAPAAPLVVAPAPPPAVRKAKPNPAPAPPGVIPEAPF